VDFPACPSCISAGKTLEDARGMAAAAVQLHRAGMIGDGDAIPAPSQLDQIMTDPQYRDAVAVLIDIAVCRPAVRVDLSLPADLLEAIDRVSGNRSRSLAEAAGAKLRQA
jgi:predicted RNase H-like HicB family nuclease